MKYTLPKAIASLEPYEPLIGDYRIRLDANESFLQLSSEWLERFQKSLTTLEFNRYPDPCARTLCVRAAEYFGVPADCVTAFDGSDELLGLLSGTFYQDGRKLAVFSHDFSMYRIYAQTYGVECLTIPKCADLTIDVDAALEFIENNGVSALLFSNPCNPTSLGLSRSEVLRLLKGTDALVLLDEAYMDFWDQSLLDCVTEHDNLMILKTCSKAVGLASIRLGFAVANERLTSILRAVKSPYNVNSVSQKFGELLFSDPDYLKSAANELIDSRRQLEDQLRLLQTHAPVLETIYPSCTNFIYIETKQADLIYQALLTESIAVRKMRDALRITAGSPEENRILLDALTKICQ